jgi:hypothetical protein
MNKKSEAEKEEKVELPSKEETQSLSEEEFQKLLADIKKRKYEGISSLFKKK